MAEVGSRVLTEAQAWRTLLMGQALSGLEVVEAVVEATKA
jgi:hypothetical protein